MNPADVAPAAATPDASILQMFWSAHIVVKAVMLGLFLASLWCWTIIFDKTRLFRKFRNEMENFEQVFWSGQSLEELYTSLSNQPNTGAAALFVAAMREWKRSFQQAAGSFRGLHARIDKVLDVSIARAVREKSRPPAEMSASTPAWRPRTAPPRQHSVGSTGKCKALQATGRTRRSVRNSPSHCGICGRGEPCRR